WGASDRAVPVRCDGSHSFEVVDVQDIAHPAGSRLPPGPASPEVHTMYQGCVALANGYIGDDWRAAYAWLGAVLPHATAWQRGAHWRACVLVSTSTWQGTFSSGTTSLHGGLTGARPAAMRCFNAPDGAQTPCTSPHTDEVVAVFRAAPGPWRGTDAVSSL